MMNSAECPSCEAKIVFNARPQMSQQVVCSTCDARLEVVWLDPLELDWAYDDEDYDAYDAFDEDESDYEEVPY